jgi:hypothetical protein
MSELQATRRIVRFLALASALTVLALVGLVVFNLIIQPPQDDGPVEEWLAIGIERRRLEDLEAMGVVITSAEYEASKKKLVYEEDRIVWDHEFPNDLVAMNDYLANRNPRTSWPFPFWMVLAIAAAVLIASLSWLNGVSEAGMEPAPDPPRER